MADAPAPITSVPSQPPAPYDAAAPDGSVVAGGWRKVSGGPCDPATGALTGEDFASSGPWRQT